MPTFDWRCPEGHVHEARASGDTKEVDCPECGQAATKIFLTPPKVGWLAMGASASASPEAIIKFDRMHRERKAQEQKYQQDHGDDPPMAGS